MSKVPESTAKVVANFMRAIFPAYEIHYGIESFFYPWWERDLAWRKYNHCQIEARAGSWTNRVTMHKVWSWKVLGAYVDIMLPVAKGP